jgi:Response regulator containing CheY-like receiver domain and AraC-type DNA-binding domain
MFSVIIADDEKILLEGLKHIINWNALGFHVIDDASNGEELLEKILFHLPELVLMDIQMPKLIGTKVIETAREAGFKGDFIVLSGFSNFDYAQSVAYHGVKHYLTKPVEEEYLERAVLKIKEKIQQDALQDNLMQKYQEKAKKAILHDCLLGKYNGTNGNLEDISFTESTYQVVLCELNKEHTIANALNLFEEDIFLKHRHIKADFITLQQSQMAIILHGERSLHHFANLVSTLNNDLFFFFGRPVSNVLLLTHSYEDSLELINRRFFSPPSYNHMSYDMITSYEEQPFSIDSDKAKSYSIKLLDCIQIRNFEKFTSLTLQLEKELKNSTSISTVRHYLTDIFLKLLEDTAQLFPDANIDYPSAIFVMVLVNKQHDLHNIILLFHKYFKEIIDEISTGSREHIIEDMLQYINQNYSKNLKLESLAQLFGYNSSYLGKIFQKKIGLSFKVYMDRIRIAHAKKFLQNENLKVYQIAELVGFSDVDYFNKKFKNYAGVTPTQYRKEHFSQNRAERDNY